MALATLFLLSAASPDYGGSLVPGQASELAARQMRPAAPPPSAPYDDSNATEMELSTGFNASSGCTCCGIALCQCCLAPSPPLLRVTFAPTPPPADDDDDDEEAAAAEEVAESGSLAGGQEAEGTNATETPASRRAAPAACQEDSPPAPWPWPATCQAQRIRLLFRIWPLSFTKV